MNSKQRCNQAVKTLLLIVFSVSVSVFFPAIRSIAADSQNFESPLVLKASKILTKEQLSGPYHKIAENVKNDGFLNHFTIQSRFGDFNVTSTFLLNKRIHELGAIAEMEKISNSDTFKRSLQDSGRKTVAGVTNLITDPGDTLSGAGRGIGNLFGRAREALNSDPSQAEDSRVENVIGMSRSKREIAVGLGVDVYSANLVLQQHLDRLARADFLGGLGVSAGLAVIPGGAGLLISTSGAARLLNEQIDAAPPSELRRNNREKLVGMGLNHDTIDLFLNNTVFSPREQTWMVAALARMEGVDNRELFLKIGLQVNDRTTSLLVAQMTVMYAGYHHHVSPLETVYPIARVLYARNKKGEAQLIIPADYITWNDRISGAISEIQDKMKGKKGFGLWTVGTVSQRAKDNLSKAGWAVHTKVWEQLDDK